VRAAALPFAAAVRLVARREFRERARDRSFLVSTGLTILIVAAVVVLPRLLGLGETTYRVAVLGSGADAVARAAAEQAQLADVSLDVVDGADRSAAERAVAGGDLDAVVDGPDVVVERELDPALSAVLENARRSVVGDEQLRSAGLDPAAVRSALTVEPLRLRTLDPQAAQSSERSGIAFLGSLVLYGQLLGYGFWVALGVVEEKSSRVVELLLSAIPARALLAGKVLGIGALGLLQLLATAVVGVSVAVAVGTIELSSTVLEPVAVVLGWFVLGFLFYSCVMAAAAARVSRQEELQNATTPVSMLALVSFFATFYVANEPASTATQVLSVVPPFSALTMPVRIASGEAAAWEAPVAVALMLGVVAVLVVVAGRVYEGAVLRMGSRVPLREAWRGGQRG
jgi:ABC-2 type transport system permease protein